MKYFNVSLEFDRHKINSMLSAAFEQNRKGYVCVVDGNVLATANKNIEYNKIINSSFVNLCDGSSIALLASLIHKQRFSTYTGPELFAKFVTENHKQYFLGNTDDNLKLLKSKFDELGYGTEQFRFEPLPFNSIVDFDYVEIAKKINEFSPEIVWISLGAPKQEFFINKLYPYIDSAVLIAIGAAFNLYLGDATNKRAPQWVRSIHLEWLYRVFMEPRRVGKRAFNYFLLLPRLIFEEIKQVRKKNTY